MVKSNDKVIDILSSYHFSEFHFNYEGLSIWVSLFTSWFFVVVSFEQLYRTFCPIVLKKATSRLPFKYCTECDEWMAQ